MRNFSEGQHIFVSGRLWHEVHPKVNVTPFLRVLENKIDLARYGDAIEKFYFTFIVIQDDFFKPAKFYSAKKKEADISIKIPYEQVENASEHETIQLMEAAYLQGIDQLATPRLKGTFDVAAFKKDVQAIFAKEKWYEPYLPEVGTAAGQ